MVNVAEYEPPPDNEGVRLWARVVQGTLIGLGVVGWFAGWLGAPPWALTLGMCWVTLVIEVWGFHAYRQWSLALMRQNVGAQCAYWFVVLAGCAAWTAFSIYHAIPVISGEGGGPMGVGAAPAYVAFAFLALSLPLHEWAIDRVERAPKKAAKAGGSTTESSLDLPAAQSAPMSAPAPARKSRPRAPKRANGPPALRIIQNAGIAAILAGMGYSPRDPAAFERAAMIARENPGLSPDEIAQRAGVARGTLWNWMNRAPEVFPVRASQQAAMA